MDTFSVHLPSGDALLGRSFEATSPKRRLLILEGMNEHALRYRDLAEYLNTFGISVYVLDSFAQGLNAPSPKDLEKWHKGAFDENVLAAHLEIQKLKKISPLPVSLMGHSMGSFMAQRYLELFPNTVESVILCGSNGPARFGYASAYAFASLLAHKRNWDSPAPFLNNVSLGAYSRAIKNRKTDLDWLSYNPDNVKAYIDDPYCGHADTYGFWKEFLRGMKELYKKKWLRQISPKEKILIISGEEDPVGECGKGPRRLAKMYATQGVKKVTLRLFPGMRHEIHNEKDHLLVYKTFAEFLG